jgi:GGDEF domain-containing protein
VPGEAFYIDQAGDREFRVCYTSVAPSQADDVAKRIMRAIAAAKRDLAAPTQLVAIV